MSEAEIDLERALRRRARRADAQRPLRRHGRRDRRGHEHPARPRLGAGHRSSTTRSSAGMKIVGIDFRDGILFVPEVLLAANAMKAGMAILRPLLAETGAEPDRQGRHRHGQGRHPRHRQEPRRDDARGRRLRGLRPRHQHRRRASSSPRSSSTSPTSSGMSALLTTTMPYMKVVIETLKRPRHPRRLHRARRRRAAERGVRRGGRRRRLLPRRRGRGRDRAGARARAPCRGEGVAGPRVDRPSCSRRRSRSTRPSVPTCSSSAAARSPASCSR